MPDLIDDLRRYGAAIEDELLPAVRMPESYADERETPRRGSRSAWPLVVVAAGVAVLVMIGAAVVLARRSGTVQTGPADVPATTRPIVSSQPLIDLPADALNAAPLIPADWQTINYGLGQISVPAGWTVSAPGEIHCEANMNALVLGRDLAAASAESHGSCGIGANPSWSAVVAVKVLTDDCLGCRSASVNGLETRTNGSNRIDLPQLQLSITYAGTIDDRITSTLTVSPAARASADGPLADTADWQIIQDGTVAALVPPHWPVHRLGATEGLPAACNSELFTDPPTAYLGATRSIIDCIPPRGLLPRVPADGVWLAAEQPLSTLPETYHLRIAGSEAQAGSPQDPNTIQLQLPGTALVAVGLGDDLTIARAILRTITPNGGTVATPSTSAAAPSPTSPPTTVPDLPRPAALGDGFCAGAFTQVDVAAGDGAPMSKDDAIGIARQRYAGMVPDPGSTITFDAYSGRITMHMYPFASDRPVWMVEMRGFTTYPPGQAATYGTVLSPLVALRHTLVAIDATTGDELFSNSCP